MIAKCIRSCFDAVAWVSGVRLVVEFSDMAVCIF